MARGFISFQCKLEGKEEPTFGIFPKSFKLDPEYATWPGEMSSTDAFISLIEEVGENGVGGIFNNSMLDAAFIWASHPGEGFFSEAYEYSEITEFLYNYCNWAHQNRETMPEEEFTEVAETPW